MRVGEAETASPPRRTFRRHHKVRRSTDYLRCYRRGRKHHGTLATLHFHPNEAGSVRLGITASRKIGKAVLRQRAKRRVREVFRCFAERSGLPHLDVVVHLKPAAGRADFQALRTELESMLSRLVGTDRR